MHERFEFILSLKSISIEFISGNDFTMSAHAMILPQESVCTSVSGYLAFNSEQRQRIFTKNGQIFVLLLSFLHLARILNRDNVTFTNSYSSNEFTHVFPLDVHAGVFCCWLG